MSAYLVKSAALYYAIVFGTGFVLALVRVPFLVPRYGVPVAELIEMPVMLIAIYFAARWITQRRSAPATTAGRFALGLIALGFLLLTEFTVVLWLQGISFREAILNRDPVSGAAYALSLIVFALMPWLVARKTSGAKHARAA